ncbi:TetR/AcrR family transcriptional regulator [Oscillibacter sp. GMB15532]|uniref:TetR/AcrR family transcriptional regulator n=1 Tax=Oscillibacter sp. GMB15532 TaxID=3230022 RepID=UPI0034E0342F
MNSKEQATQQLMIDTAKALLEETDDVEKITVRQIAERANVGIGLINYHFKSKDNLLSIAIGDTMAKIILDFSDSHSYADLSPIQKLKTMLKELYALSDQKEKLMRFIVSSDMMNGNMQTPLHLIPLLKQIFGDKKDDMELRILALQILYPIQVTGLNRDAFYMYSGIDVSNEEQRSRFIENLINNLTVTEQKKNG